ncbi:CsbD family protein [Thalassoglobus polymorphus]|uniref:CsbD-like domain-containing protein n=1 Tax=Thalassoglobus polymorphus TaxID=2527994 RepID=A0A517QUI8_9PLAN|nr:CsbD family protein [Thalassoglobus polymorphus]QDT35306.1 hypothetical protein Mal48_45820 [Thalassoglobus polymorphus]
MVTREELTGKWEQVQGELIEKWGELSGDTLDQFRGNTEQLVGLIHEKTGVAKEEVQKYVDSTIQNIYGAYEGVSEQMEVQLDHAKDLVRRKPMESLGVALGAGVVTGLLVGLILYPRR